MVISASEEVGVGSNNMVSSGSPRLGLSPLGAGGFYPQPPRRVALGGQRQAQAAERYSPRSEEHTSELQSRGHLVCRLLLEKKKSIENTEYHSGINREWNGQTTLTVSS